MENEVKKKESYFLGIIGAIVGGIIATIPLAFGYANSEFIFLLAITIVVPFLEFYGYKWLKGKIDNKLPIILMILTIFVVSIMIFAFLPATLLIKFRLPINFEEINAIYANRNIVINLLEDYLLSLVFGVLGAYVVGSITKKKLLLNISNINLFSSDNKEKQDFKEKAITILKPAFEKYGSIQKEKTITKEELLADIKETNFNDYFNYLRQLGIVKKYKGKYYYSTDDENNIKIHYSMAKIIAIMCAVVLLAVAILFSFGLIKNREVKKVYNDDVSFKIDTSWNLLEDYTEETGWVYYNYLGEESEEDSIYAYPSTIGIAYEKESSGTYNSISELKSILEQYINEYLGTQYSVSLFTTSKGYDALELTTSYDTGVEFDYYIYKDGKIACITAISYTADDDVLDELEEDAKDVVDSFEWNK